MQRSDGERTPPVFDLETFSKKAGSANFYIQTLSDHLKNYKFINSPHRHDFYLILYITRGSGVHTIDFTDYPVKPRSVFLMTPGQVHSWNLDKKTEGYIVFFTRAFYRMQMRESNLTDFPFYHSLTATPAWVIGEDRAIDFVFEEMHTEFRENVEVNLRLLRNYLDILLLKLARYFPKTGGVPQNSATYKLRKLAGLIEANYRKVRQPGQYADMMNLSTSYLNSLCKEALGKTLTQLIHERVILEARRLFSYSDANVNEVAAALNFTDVSYFIRFFRKHTGMTPEAFKKSVLSPI